MATRTGGRALWALVAFAALLVAVWPIVNRSLADSRPVPDGRTVTVGLKSVDRTASLRLGPGWSMRTSASNDLAVYLVHGAATLRFSYVSPPEKATARQMWDGLARLLRVEDPKAEADGPVPYGAKGAGGVTGTVRIGGVSGPAVIVPAPDGSYFAQIITLADGLRQDDRNAAARAAATLAFPEGAR